MPIHKILTSGMLVSVLAVSACVLSTSRAGVAQEASLYDRLGGYDAISAVVDDFADKLFSDDTVGPRFFGRSDDSREGFKQKNKNLVCNVTSGPCEVISRSAAAAHGGLGIAASEFDVVAQYLVDTLDDFDVPDREQQELLDVVEGEITAFVGDARVDVGPGAFAALPRGVPHTIRVKDASAKLLLTVVPAGVERFFVPKSDADGDPTTFGLELHGPPPA